MLNLRGRIGEYIEKVGTRIRLRLKKFFFFCFGVEADIN